MVPLPRDYSDVPIVSREAAAGGGVVTGIVESTGSSVVSQEVLGPPPFKFSQFPCLQPLLVQQPLKDTTSWNTSAMHMTTCRTLNAFIPITTSTIIEPPTSPKIEKPNTVAAREEDVVRRGRRAAARRRPPIPPTVSP